MHSHVAYFLLLLTFITVFVDKAITSMSTTEDTTTYVVFNVEAVKYFLTLSLLIVFFY